MTPFEKLVMEMREHQKRYFKYKMVKDLKKSKELEKQVDIELEKKAVTRLDL